MMAWQAVVRRRTGKLAIASVAAIGGAAAMAASAGATFRGPPGPIVFRAASPASGPVAKFGSSGNGDIYSVRSDGSGMRRLTPRTPPTKLDPAEGQAAVSPDGRRIAYVRAHSSGAGIYVMQANGSKRRRIRSSGGSPAWSPDGRWIAFSHPKGGIHVMRSNGRAAREVVAPVRVQTQCPPQVTPERCERMRLPVITYGIGAPSWSPDGTRIAFSQEEPDGSAGVYTVPKSGGQKTLVVEKAIKPDWSPDGERLLFLDESGPSNALWVARSDGTGGATRLAKGDIFEASFSPDGSRIVYVRNSSGKDITIIRSVTGKVVRRLVGGKVFTSEVTWGTRP